MSPAFSGTVPVSLKSGASLQLGGLEFGASPSFLLFSDATSALLLFLRRHDSQNIALAMVWESLSVLLNVYSAEKILVRAGRAFFVRLKLKDNS